MFGPSLHKNSLFLFKKNPKITLIKKKKKKKKNCFNLNNLGFNNYPGEPNYENFH